MPRLRNVLMLLATLAALSPATASAELFFSEYIEGSSFNKAIEIYNPSGVPVDLSDYELRLRSNGAASPGSGQTVVLSGTLNPGDVFVAANPQANAGILAVADLQSSTVINWNGDDSIELHKLSSDVTVDVVGQFGFDPGAEWTAGGVSTLNRTLRRKADVCAGDTNGNDAFDPSLEWDGFAQDDITGLGAHTAACGPTPTHNSTWGRVKSLYR